jgi:RNA polymerase sigma-70 factor (ECF subfamily)
MKRPGRYQLEAAVQSAHAARRLTGSTDWNAITLLYAALFEMTGSPVVALNRAVAVAELDGPEVALAIVDGLDLATYHAWHATRADLLRRLGRYDEARAAYDDAIGLAGNSAERAWLTLRRDGLPA